MQIVPVRLISIGGCAVASITLMALVVACDKPPNDVTGPTSRVSVEVSGPDRLAPGQSAQYTVTVLSSDGVNKVPTSIHWTASPSSRLQVNELGLATGGQVYGDAAVNASVTIADVGFKVVGKSVVVLPDGTYRIVGTVGDATSAGVSNALIEVTPGPLSTTTEPNGHYSLYGVPADAEFRITAYGYEPFVQHLDFNTHETRNFQLTPGQISSLAGNYTLSIDAIGPCPQIAADLQHRRYDAVVTQDRLIIDVALTESRFLSGSNRFRGKADTGGATFGLESVNLSNGTFSSIVERLPDGTFLTADGTVVTIGSGAGLSGTMNGSLSVWSSRFWTLPFADFPPERFGQCSGKHQFTLTPR
jgi:hypothetical protein